MVGRGDVARSEAWRISGGLLMLYAIPGVFPGAEDGPSASLVFFSRRKDKKDDFFVGFRCSEELLNACGGEETGGERVDAM